MLALPPAIHAVPGSNMNSQFRDALTHRFRVTEVASFNLSQSSCDPGFRHLVSNRCDPVYEGRTPVLIPVVDEFDHKG